MVLDQYKDELQLSLLLFLTSAQALEVVVPEIIVNLQFFRSTSVEILKEYDSTSNPTCWDVKAEAQNNLKY